jgi:hypothetical protein
MPYDLGRAPTLPRTKEELFAGKTRQRTLNDYVHDVHVDLWDNPEYQKLLEAVTNDEAVEGSIKADNLMAARMIREVAITEGNNHLKEKPLTAISKAINVIQDRYKQGRGRRRKMLAGIAGPETANEE